MRSNAEVYGDRVPTPIPQELIDERLEILRDRLTKELKKDFFERDMYLEESLQKHMKFWSKINKVEV